MRILLVHQNMPGQYRHVAPALVRAGHEVIFVTQREDLNLPGVRRVNYKPPRSAAESTHHYTRLYENSVIIGQQVARVMIELERQKLTPDVIVAHPGWGEVLFAKDVFPSVPLLNYCEFYYAGRGADIGFSPEDPATIDSICRARARNAHLLLSLESADAGVSPTEWQKSRHPAPLSDKIEVIFDGIDTATVKPDPAARFELDDGRVLTAQDEVLTYVARNLEPYRGFPSFIRALPKILAERPNLTVLICGGDEVSYGKPAPEGKSWREHMLAEVGLDLSRVHFTGKLPYNRYLSLLQVSSLHLYLTVPFVLSWSCLEAMAAGCLMLGSATPPVQEVIEDGVNGWLCDFNSPDDIAAKAVAMLADRAKLAPLREAARATVLEGYALDLCLPRHLAKITAMAG